MQAFISVINLGLESKMEGFIFDTRKKISIINLEMTQEYLSAAASKAEEICSGK